MRTDWRGRGAAFAVLGLGALLGGCAAPETRPEPPAETAPPRDLLAEVRAAAVAAEAEGIDVSPLREPVVEDLRASAAQREAARDFDGADAALEHALRLVPGDPELLQWRAELALARGALDDAVRLAGDSYELGPRLGALCRRSWTVIRLARELTGHPDAAATAQHQLDRCTLAPPVRM